MDARGAELGWLIDGDHQTVYLYRAGDAQPEIRTGIATLAWEGPVEGFVLDLTPIWAAFSVRNNYFTGATVLVPASACGKSLDRICSRSPDSRSNTPSRTRFGIDA